MAWKLELQGVKQRWKERQERDKTHKSVSEASVPCLGRGENLPEVVRRGRSVLFSKDHSQSSSPPNELLGGFTAKVNYAA